MHGFIPKPDRSSEQWASDQVINILDGDEYLKFYIHSETWICHAVFLSEPYAPINGYPVLFKTSTDCLLWLRWWVLPSAFLAEKDIDGYEMRGKDIALAGRHAALAALIDGCPEGTDVAEFLEQQGSVLAEQLSNADFDVYPPRSILQWLSDQGSLEEWQKALEDSTMTCVAGIWHLSDATWFKLEELYINSLQMGGYLRSSKIS